MDKIKIDLPIIVEGKYDKIKVSSVIDGEIITTDGFGVFKSREKLALIKRLSQNGVIILTDSDGAGFVIRNFLKKTIDGKYLKHAYIPDIPGKERRKITAGKEGKLGVEGMTPEVILNSLRHCGATFENNDASTTRNIITKQDLMDMGLSGGKDSSGTRKALLKFLQFPEHMSSNAMLQALELLYTQDELSDIVAQALETCNG